MANLLSASDLAEIKAVVAEIVQDTSVNTTIKYRQHDTSQMGLVAIKNQEISHPYKDWSEVSALRGLLATDELASGAYEIGDVPFVVMQSSVSGAVSIADKIYDTESGTTYDIKQIFTDPIGVVYRFITRAS